MSAPIAVDTSKDHLRIVLDLPVPPARAWAALTAPDALARWWGDYVTLEPRLGGRLRETWTDRGGRAVMTSGAITRFEPPHLLVLTWADDDWSAQTEVVFTLEEAPSDRTRLALEHRGWGALKGRDTSRLIADHAAGWHHHLASLRSYLAA